MKVYSHFLRDAEHSETLFINELSCEKEKQGTKVYKFGFGQSPFLPPEHIIQSLKDHAHHKEYLNVQGLPALREAVANFHSKVDNLNISSDQVMVAPGSKILIFAIMSTFTSADVFLVTPSWVSYEPQAKLAGHNVIRLRSTFESKWRVTPEQIQDACDLRKDKSKPLLMVLNYPGNPDGLTYSDDQLKRIASVAKKNNIIIISDEIYGLLNHDGNHTSLAKYYPEGTIITNGLSKWCGAGGWRLGIAILPKEFQGSFQDCLVGIASETYSSATSPVQYAAITAYDYNDKIKRFLDLQRQLLSYIGNYAAKQLNKTGIQVHPPEGGFYLSPDFSPIREALIKRGITSNSALCNTIMKECSVAILPGNAFGYLEDQLVTRLAYVDFDGTTALKALQKGESLDLKFLTKYCPKIVEGIEALASWIEKNND
jgi:aspartate aminotransferase